MKYIRSVVVIAVVLTLFMLTTDAGNAEASEWAEYWFPVTCGSTQYDAARITVSTPSYPGFTSSLTSKACIRLQYLVSSQISVGWKTANGWTCPRSYYSYPIHVGFNEYMEVDVLKQIHLWGASKCYELVHPPSGGTFTWQVWINHSGPVATIESSTSDGDHIGWSYDAYRAGGRTSNNSTKHWSHTSLFERRTNYTTWAPVGAANLNTSSGWLNVSGSSQCFTVWSDNW